MEETAKLLPQVPVLKEYKVVKQELSIRIAALNAITELTEDNKKDVKTAISEINKVSERIKRYRIDESAKFMEYISPYVEQCKDLEKLCTEGVSQIKLKVTELETQERKQKTDTIRQLFDFALDACSYRSLLKFEMFFEQSMANKTTSLTVIEAQLNAWIEARVNDIDFIKKNTDEADSIIAIYLQNGLKLTTAIETQQERYKSESEIKAMIQSETKPQAQQISSAFEKKIDITVKINKLPQSKVKALQAFLDGLNVEWELL